MDKRIIKTTGLSILTSVMALTIPVIGQWYEQQTGIYPVGFYALSAICGLIITVLTALKIWGEIK